MNRRAAILTGVGVLGLLLPVAHAGVIDFYWDVQANPFKSTHTCSFDYALQQFTIVDTIYEIDLRPQISLRTLLDSDSTFSVVETIVNNTGLTWTDYQFECGSALITGSPATLVYGSVTSTKLQTIAYYGMDLFFTGSPVVLDGESFTIEYNLEGSGPHYSYDNRFFHRPIPEPTTIVLLGLGGLALLRRRSSIKGTRKA